MLHFLLCQGACLITEATNAPSHLERNLKKNVSQRQHNFAIICNFSGKFLSSNSKELLSYHGPKSSKWVELTHYKFKMSGAGFFLSVYLIASGLVCRLPVCFCRCGASPSCRLPRSRYLSPPVCRVPALASRKLRCHSCAVSHLSAFKHVCLLTCTAFDGTLCLLFCASKSVLGPLLSCFFLCLCFVSSCV